MTTTTTKSTLTQTRKKRLEFVELFFSSILCGLPQKLILSVTLPKAVSMGLAEPQLKYKELLQKKTKHRWKKRPSTSEIKSDIRLGLPTTHGTSNGNSLCGFAGLKTKRGPKATATATAANQSECPSPL